MSNFKESVAIGSFSFRLGYNQVQLKDVDAVKKELMDALHILSNSTFLRRINGEVEPKQSEITAIERVFNNHGITNVWGE